MEYQDHPIADIFPLMDDEHLAEKMKKEGGVEVCERTMKRKRDAVMRPQGRHGAETDAIALMELYNKKRTSRQVNLPTS